MSTPTTPVLMSADNPTGWKLEELLPQLCAELRAKNARIAGDASHTASAVRANNLRITESLAIAEQLQRDNLWRLDQLAPDPGPAGPPRIGAGAPAAEA